MGEKWAFVILENLMIVWYWTKYMPITSIFTFYFMASEHWSAQYIERCKTGRFNSCWEKKYIYFWKSGSLVLVPFSLIQFIKSSENNETFSLQFVYQAWITDPKTALRQRRKEKKRSAREEQKRRRKESGEGEWWRGLAADRHRTRDKLGRNEIFNV